MRFLRNSRRVKFNPKRKTMQTTQKVTVKFPHSHEGKKYEAGSVLELSTTQAEWLCNQKIDGQPCAVPYEGSAVPANAESQTSLS